MNLTCSRKTYFFKELRIEIIISIWSPSRKVGLFGYTRSFQSPGQGADALSQYMKHTASGREAPSDQHLLCLLAGSYNDEAKITRELHGWRYLAEKMAAKMIKA